MLDQDPTNPQKRVEPGGEIFYVWLKGKDRIKAPRGGQKKLKEGKWVAEKRKSSLLVGEADYLYVRHRRTWGLRRRRGRGDG